MRKLILASLGALLVFPAAAHSQPQPVCPLATLAMPRPEGVAQFVVVGQPQPCPPSGGTRQDFDVTTDFGDGTLAATPFREDDPLWFVGGVHTYRRAGTYQLVGTATDRRTGNRFVLRRTIEVPNAPLTVRPGRRPTFVAGKKAQREIGRFTDGNPLAAARDFTTSVRWGDGSASRASVVRRGPDFVVLGTHRYRTARQRTITVTIRDDRDGTLRLRTKTTVRR